MKVYIRTFNNALSYGAMMQAYALSEVMKKLGHSVMLLNTDSPGNELYTCEQREKLILEANESIVKKCAKYMRFKCFEGKYEKRKALLFQEFKNSYLKEIPSLCDVSKEDYKRSCIVCGSDQIWNPEITHGFNPAYFGVNDHNIKSFAYAGSIGDIKFARNDSGRFCKLLATFRSVSCREKDLNDYLVDKGIQSTQVLDPTLLLAAERYDYLINGIEKKSSDKYLLVYYLGKRKTFTKYADRIAKQFGLKVIYLCGSNIPITLNKNTFGDASPEEFVSLIRNADYVLTNSFHGLAFSLIYEKSFNIVLPAKRPERLLNLLDVICLKHRVLGEEEECVDTNIDYVYVKEKLAPYIEKSYQYIVDAIGD